MVWGRNVREIFGKSLHRTDRLVYRLLTLILSVFSPKLVPDNCLQLPTATVAYTDGIRMLRFWNFLHCVPTNFVCVFIRTQINLIAYSCCFNWVNTQIRCLSGALSNGRSVRIENSVTRDNGSASLGKPNDAEQLPS